MEASTKQALKSLSKSELDFIYNWKVADYRKPVDINNIDEFIHRLKDEWFNAILDGRIIYKNWDREEVCFNNAFCPLFKQNMDYEIELLRANLKQYPLHSQERTESIHLINTISQFREKEDPLDHLDKMEELSKLNEANLTTSVVSEPNTKRKDILSYINECNISGNAKYLVFTWWNNIYIKTIADKYRTPFLKFSSFNTDDVQGRFNKNDLLAFRIQDTKLSSNKKKNRNVNTIKSVQIPGILIEIMMNISTPLYSQIRNNVHRVLKKEKNGLSNEKIFDISLLANDYLSEYKTKKQRMKEAFTPLFNALVLGVMLFLFDSGLLNNQTRIGFIIWILILAISSIPFDRIESIVNIRKKEISATLVIDYDDE